MSNIGTAKSKKSKTNRKKPKGRGIETGKPAESIRIARKPSYIRGIVLSIIIGSIASGLGLWTGSLTFIILLVAIFAALSVLLVIVISRSNIISWRVGIWSVAILITCTFIYTNEPLSYEGDTMELWRFSSDARSVSNGVRYDQCTLLPIGNATSDSVLLWFGCKSSQLVKIQDELPEHIIIEYGNCDSVVDFNRSLINNEYPDFLIEFPFQIDGVGRICKQRLYLRNGDIVRSEVIPLSTLAASHLDDRNDTLIVEWTDAPSNNEFSFYGYNLFKKVSYDKMSVYWDVDDQWKREADLENNMPNSFHIELRIPAEYKIEDLEKYEISHETHGLDEDSIIVKTDLVKDKILHLVIVDNTKHQIKIVFSALFGVFALAVFIDAILSLQRKGVK